MRTVRGTTVPMRMSKFTLVTRGAELVSTFERIDGLLLGGQRDVARSSSRRRPACRPYPAWRRRCTATGSAADAAARAAGHPATAGWPARSCRARPGTGGWPGPARARPGTGGRSAACAPLWRLLGRLLLLLGDRAILLRAAARSRALVHLTGRAAGRATGRTRSGCSSARCAAAAAPPAPTPAPPPSPRPPPPLRHRNRRARRQRERRDGNHQCPFHCSSPVIGAPRSRAMR